MENYFKALSDRTRIEILLLIKLNPDICLCNLENCFQLSNSNLSRHLKELELSGLISSYKKGKWKHYLVTESGDIIIATIKQLDVEGFILSVNGKSANLNKGLEC